MNIDWIALIEDSFTTQNGRASWFVSPIWHSPVSDAEILAMERVLNTQFPQQLSEVLTLSNGVGQTMELDEESIDIGDLLWSIERIKSENLLFRRDQHLKSRGVPVRDLFLFADAGNGDSYGFIVSKERVCPGSIIIHDHETNECSEVAPSLEHFIRHLK